MSPRRRLSLVLFAFACVLPGCTSAPPLDLVQMSEEWARYMQNDYVLRPGDRVTVTLYPEQDEVPAAQEVTLAPQGSVTLTRLPDGIRAVGTTVESFRRRVEAAYGELYAGVEVIVSLVEATAQSVYVTGEVGESGAVPYTHGLTATQAIAASGGLLPTAAWSDIRILRAPGTSKDRTQRLDVAGIFHEGRPDFVLLPGDIVFCRPSGIANVATFLQLYLWNLLPLQGGGVTPAAAF